MVDTKEVLRSASIIIVIIINALIIIAVLLGQ